MVKTLRKDIFISSLIIAIFIFGTGFFLGAYQDKFRIDEGTELIRTNELDAESFLVERDFFNIFEIDNCQLQESRLEKFSEDLGEIGRTLARYDAKKLIGTKDYNYLKRKYFILEIKTYTLKKEILEKCKLNTSTILFFYDVNNNEESLRQGYVLDVLVKDNPSISVFSIDREFEEDILLASIKAYHNITTSPTMILNYKTKIEGFISEIELKELLNKDGNM